MTVGASIALFYGICALLGGMGALCFVLGLKSH